MASKNYQMDMCRGPLFRQMVLFSLPLMASTILQLTFNAVDMIVVGQFASHRSLAAVGSCGSIIALLVNVFCALSVGTNVLVSRYFGAKKEKDVQKCVHTSIAIALYGGIALGILGQFLARPLLVITGTPEEVLPEAAVYLRIMYAGIPCIMLYNFGCAVLRSIGDTRRPLYFLILAGILNVILNLIFVICFKMTASGVGLATTLSHCLSAFLILKVLTGTRASYGLNWPQVKIDRQQCLEILKIGIPAAVQSSAFSISNVILQSAINSFGAQAIAGSVSTGVIEGMVYAGSGAYHQTGLSFTAQNYGGRQFDRIKKIIFLSMALAGVSTLVVGNTLLCFGTPLLRLFTDSPEVISWGLQRMTHIFSVYALCGFMDAASGCMRGLGYSLTSSVICVAGVCGFRLLWILVIFPMHRTFPMLLASYPLSWGLAAIITSLILWWIWKNKLVPMRNHYQALQAINQ